MAYKLLYDLIFGKFRKMANLKRNKKRTFSSKTKQ